MVRVQSPCAAQLGPNLSLERLLLGSSRAAPKINLLGAMFVELWEEREGEREITHFQKDNLRHLDRFPDFVVTFRILAPLGIFA